MERKNAWKKYSEEKRKAVFAFGEDYKKFLDEETIKGLEEI